MTSCLVNRYFGHKYCIGGLPIKVKVLFIWFPNQGKGEQSRLAQDSQIHWTQLLHFSQKFKRFWRKIWPCLKGVGVTGNREMPATIFIYNIGRTCCKVLNTHTTWKLLLVWFDWSTWWEKAVVEFDDIPKRVCLTLKKVHVETWENM